MNELNRQAGRFYYKRCYGNCEVSIHIQTGLVEDMISTRILTLASMVVLLFTAGVVSVDAAEPETPINVGSRLELLLDDWLIESMEGLSFVLHTPRLAETVVLFDKPWENGGYCDYVTVFQDGDLYRMYYACHLGAPLDFGGGGQATCYAESRDGIHWTKPSLGIIESDGSKENNIVWRGTASHNFTPFIDTKPGVPADQKYKAVGGYEPKDGNATDNPHSHRIPELFASADAIHWRKIGEVFVPTIAQYDSQNIMSWDALQEQYTFYFRIWEGARRHIARSTSPDLRTWSDGRSIDLGGAPAEQLYTNATIPYFRAPHLYLSFPMRLTSHPPLVKVVSKYDGKYAFVCDSVFMFSRDGLHFSRRYMEAFMRPGRDRRNWTKHSVMIALGLLPLTEDEISLYVIRNFWSDSNHLIRAVLRTDGFVSVRGPYAGGELISKPILFSGQNLVINAETSGVGSIRVEIQDAAGNPLPGFGLEDCVEFYGDAIAHVVRFKGGGDVGALAGKPIRLRFVLRDADLYSLRFVPVGTGQARLPSGSLYRPDGPTIIKILGSG